MKVNHETKDDGTNTLESSLSVEGERKHSISNLDEFELMKDEKNISMIFYSFYLRIFY